MKPWMNKPLFWPLVVFGLLLLFNLVFKPEFFSIRYQNGHLYGSLIDILNFGSPLAIIAIGMTLVIASRGIDLSVGSLVAISGATACLAISKGAQYDPLGLYWAPSRWRWRHALPLACGTDCWSPARASSRSSPRSS